MSPFSFFISRFVAAERVPQACCHFLLSVKPFAYVINKPAYAVTDHTCRNR